MTLPRYVLITPARNETEFIELTIKSVVAQTFRPVKWVIVSDGSTDGTDEIVGRYTTDHPWIELVRMPERSERHFAGKVYAFNAGLGRLQDLEYDVVGSLDGDVSFDEEYFAFLVGKLEENPKLGLVGTPFKDDTGFTYDYNYVSTEHVSGACQLFRRECFEQVGGFVPVKGGGVDVIAVLTARMMGWKTQTFTEKMILHHRGLGTAEHGALIARFRAGAKDYALGNLLIWELSRTAYQLKNRPLVCGGLMLLLGYLWSMVRRVNRPISPELVQFRQREQIQRLKKLMMRKHLWPQPPFEASSR
jgi:glycosyltransferase involved in cell wall biosynthesis